MYYVLVLIDEITKLFYKVAGINFNDGVVESGNMFDQLLNQKVVGTWYGIFMAVAVGLVLVFTLVAILKSMASDDPSEQKKSVGPILKNIGLAVLLLIVTGPIILFFISFISNAGVWIARLGGDANISIADIIFSNSGNLVTAYNEKFVTEFTSFRDLGNDFLYELMYNPASEEGSTALVFHWYIILLGGGFVLYNLSCMVIDVVKRIFNVILLYLGSPFAISKMALDDGKSFKEWQSRFFKEFVLLFAQIGTFMIFVALVNILNNIDFEALATSEAKPGDELIGGLVPPSGVDEEVKEEIVTNEYSLLNGIGRTLIIMAAISVTRSSATMLTELLTSKETRADNLLENVITRFSRNTPTSRTRTITRNMTTTKRETIFVEQNPNSSLVSSAGNIGSNKNTNTIVNNHNVVNQNVSVNNKFNSTNNISNRVVKDGIRKGTYENKPSPATIYVNTTKQVPVTNVETFKYINAETKKTATAITKEYAKANTNLNSTISNGDNSRLQAALREYTKAYSNEAELLSRNYRDFEVKASATMKSEVSTQTKQELKNITNAYRKAQMDYNKTASKLSKYEGERMSTADALKIKEQADKQRETLMSASNKAAQFYENQKKGE